MVDYISKKNMLSHDFYEYSSAYLFITHDLFDVNMKALFREHRICNMISRNTEIFRSQEELYIALL